MILQMLYHILLIIIVVYFVQVNCIVQNSGGGENFGELHICQYFTQQIFLLSLPIDFISSSNDQTRALIDWRL